ncbi:MAG TPA: ATP-binding protein, partial [Hyphomicrobiaceae bacterium]|nr:ATP-binding protein [Hyphomicrobiaceae bacterium]
IEKTRASASHGAALVQQLLAFARGADGRRIKLDPRQALEDLQPLVRQSLPAHIKLAVQARDPLWTIQADATQFNQVFINLCINARDAMPQGGQIDVVAQNVQVDEPVARANPGVAVGPYVRISVVDTGGGISHHIIEKIFDPFFTTKASGKGTGLGLSMVAGIMKSHGGFVHVDSEEGKGATFHLYFPAMAQAGPSTETTSPHATPERGKGEGILLIDDEPSVRDSLRLLLQRAGYRVFAASDGGSGLAAFEQHRAEIALAITDMMLPDQIGTEVVRTLRRLDPQLPIVAISGMMASGEFEELLHLTPPVQCFGKPLLPVTLLGAVRRGLATAPTNSAGGRGASAA